MNRVGVAWGTINGWLEEVADDGTLTVRIRGTGETCSFNVCSNSLWGIERFSNSLALAFVATYDIGAGNANKHVSI